MTVTVETPEGIKTGSTVREMSNTAPDIDWPDVGNPADVKGEAVVVDLGERGVLFALISHQSDLEFYNAFPTDGPATPAGIKYYASLPLGSKGVLNPRNPPGYPKLVTFTDLSDPQSVTLVQVWERNKQGYFDLKEDRFEQLFGQSVKIHDIALELTNEPVTDGITTWLPWLKTIGGGYLHGGFTSKGSPLGLDGGNFKTGEPK
ncbi:hypothetical protein [Rhizorhapis sp. SPR117]|uniref:hypothetical protein n=1 Tax=Rhizorhapis sp. SPR117 TaxID=2912611 RepID=UPI001F21F9DF|nr:hypothetical protein [Rhizorhapis sp. SPR117]